MHLLALTLAASAASDTEQTTHLLTAIKAVSSELQGINRTIVERLSNEDTTPLLKLRTAIRSY
jgi:hypothetical protein